MYNETSPPPPPHPHPQHSNNNNNNNSQIHSPWSAIPTGWTTVVSPDDGRIYYLEEGTGRTSWVHPRAIEKTGFSSSVDPPAHTNYNTSTTTTSHSGFENFWTGGLGKFWHQSRRGRDSTTNTNSPQQPILSSPAQPQQQPPLPTNNNNSNNNNMTRIQYLDTPWNASRRPQNHQCYAVCALILCFPIGICALFQSIMVDRAWDQGRYGDAVNHSRQAKSYSCFGTGIGICFWIYWFFFTPAGQKYNNIRFFDGFDFNFFD